MVKIGSFKNDTGSFKHDTLKIDTIDATVKLDD
jgi:hypothetical protein